MDIILGEQEAGRISADVRWVHESTRVLGVAHAKRVSKFMGGHQEQIVFCRVKKLDRSDYKDSKPTKAQIIQKQ